MSIEQKMIPDPMWRWQTGGVAALSSSQREDADAIFTRWIQKTHNFTYKGYDVRNFEAFVLAVQSASTRSCGLEKYKISQVTDINDPRLSQVIERVNVSIANMLNNYNHWDQEFERLKYAEYLLPYLEISDAAVNLDHSAWQVCKQSIMLADLAKRLGAKIAGSPLSHVFLQERARQWVVACLIKGLPEIEIPDIPYPVFETLDTGIDEDIGNKLQEWLNIWGAQTLINKRKEAGKKTSQIERAEMMRWLERFGMLEEDASTAEGMGAQISATSRALGAIQREDLRNLRSEMASMFAVRADIADHQAKLKQFHAQANLVETTRLGTIVQRLNEMHNYHHSKALYICAKSFHFEPDVQTEAAVIAPKLIATARTEFANEVDQTSSEINNFMIDKTESEREAMIAMAEASHELGKTDGITATAKKIIERIIEAGRILGAEFLADMRSILPAMAGQTVKLAQQSKPTRLELLNARIDDWQIEGLSRADRSMREADTRVEWEKAKENVIAYASSIAKDERLFQAIQNVDPPCAVWIEKTSGVENPTIPPPQRESENSTSPNYTPNVNFKGN